MRHTVNLGLSLYDSEDKMNITGSENSLNHNMELIDKYLKEHSTVITSEMAKSLYIVLKDVAFDPNSPYEKDLKNFMNKWCLTDADIEFAVAGYTRVKYIDNKARCMIDTGYTPNINTRCVVTFMLYDSDDNCNTIAGTSNSTQGPGYIIGADPITTGGNVWGRINDSTVNLYTGGAKLKSNTVYTYDFSKDAVTINGEQIPLNGTAANLTTLNNHLYLFIRKVSSASSHDVHPSEGNSKHMAVYRFSIYENGELKMDLIPAIRDIDDKPGLYDVIGENFLMNVGNKAYEFGYEKLDGTYIDPIV